MYALHVHEIKNFEIQVSVYTAHTALSVYTRSPAALRSFKLLQLPCVRTLKYYIDANLEDAGEVEQCLIEKKEQYDKMVFECVDKKSERAGGRQGWQHCWRA